MQRRSREAYLWDIADSCRAILEFMQGCGLPDYEQDRMLRRAVERELSIVGEAVSQGTRRFPDLEESIGTARQIVGFRNRIIHGYADVDSNIVWAIVQNEVPRLLEKFESILMEKPLGDVAWRTRRGSTRSPSGPRPVPARRGTPSDVLVPVLC